MKISKFTNNKGLLTKRITREGNDIVKHPAATLYDGVAERVEVDDLTELSNTIKVLKPNQALTYGVFLKPGNHYVVTTKDKRTDGAIARCSEDMTWPEGAAVLMLDYDPQPGKAALTYEELNGALVRAVPELSSISMLWTPSASSCIKSEDGCIDTNISGQRLYIEVADGRNIPMLGNIIFNRMILTGHGYVFHSRNGLPFIRTLVDSSVWQPERLDFAAGASCGEGLRREPVDHKFLGGKEHHKLVKLKPLTDDELPQVEALNAVLL